EIVPGLPRLEPVARQDLAEGGALLPGRGPGAGALDRVPADRAPELERLPGEVVPHRRAIGTGRLDGLRHEARRDVVAARRQRQVDLAVRAPVQLGGAAGTGTGPAGEAAVLDVEQALGGQLVEVEGGEPPLHADGRGRLVATDRLGAARDDE